MDEQPIADARANLSELTSRIRHLRTSVRITSRGKPQATLTTVELGDAAEAVGGPDKAVELLRQMRQKTEK